MDCFILKAKLYQIPSERSVKRGLNIKVCSKQKYQYSGYIPILCRLPKKKCLSVRTEESNSETFKLCLSRDVFLPQSEASLLPSALFLHRHRLRPLLHDGLRLLDVLLAGPQGSARQSGPGSDDPAGDVHHAGQHTELPPARGLHQGHRRLVRGLCLLRLRSFTRVRNGQLRLQVRCQTTIKTFLIFKTLLFI